MSNYIDQIIDEAKIQDPTSSKKKPNMKNMNTLSMVEQEALKEKVTEILKDIYDPEIPVNIYDLGLIYSLETNAAAEVAVEMTLTSPACPVAETFPQTVQERIIGIPGVSKVAVTLVWEPTWTKDRMSEIAKLQLNMF